jgi:AcrR family transcriptional regulator
MIRPKNGTVPKSDPEARIAAAAFRLLASHPWRDLTIASVSHAAKMPLAQVLKIAPSRPDLIAILLRETERETVRRYRPEPGQRNARDRMFDVVMSWFDVQRPRKRALGNLYRDLARDPITLLALRGQFLRMSAGFLALAEADAGLASTLRAAGLAAIVARSIRVWLDDDREMGKTMAQLERDLRRLDRIL